GRDASVASLPAAVLLEAEALAQQPTRIVGDAAQPGFVGQPLFALGGRLRRLLLRAGIALAVVAGLLRLRIGRLLFRLVATCGGSVVVPARIAGAALAAVVALVVLALVAVAATLGRLALHRRQHCLAVGLRILHAGLQAQGLVVGGDGLLVLALPRQRVAVVVVRIRAGQALPRRGRCGVVLAVVSLRAFAQALVRLLVGPPPPVAIGRSRGLPRQAQAQRQHREHPLAAEAERDQQQQRQQQPVTLVAPERPGLVLAGDGPGRVDAQHGERLQVAAVGCRRGVATAAGGGERA